MSHRNWIKAGLSLFIVYHVLAIVIYPNPQSVLARSLAPILNPYGNQLGLNSTWRFYSPDPGTIRHYEYKVVQELENDFKIETYVWPDPEGSWWQANRARMLTFVTRTVLNPINIYSILTPYLCRKHPKATSISFKAVTELNPSIEQAFNISENFERLGQRYEMPIEEIGCEREAEEVSDEA